jgi:8-oxo-dGTP pyrophosphatase MutT (NUDIX family)
MTTIAYQGDYFSIHIDANGIEFVYTGDEVLVVPLTAEGKVLLTLEPAPAFGEPTLVLPGGSTETDEPPTETANRELQEEIGFRAGQLDFLGQLRPFSKYLTVRSYVYLARDLTPSQLVGDENYTISVEHVPLALFETLITAGRLLDARVIAALYMAQSFLKDKAP